MLDDSVPASRVRTSICPWCSATYGGEPDTCPSCGAALAVDPAVDPTLPGLTAIDPEAILRAKAPVVKPRNRLLSWISGEYPDEAGTVAEEGALAPPPVEVRREMLRLALAAEVANLQAEADSFMADAASEGPQVAPADAAPTETGPAEGVPIPETVRTEAVVADDAAEPPGPDDLGASRA